MLKWRGSHGDHISISSPGTLTFQTGQTAVQMLVPYSVYGLGPVVDVCKPRHSLLIFKMGRVVPDSQLCEGANEIVFMKPGWAYCRKGRKVIITLSFHLRW